jgi:hypothetical protein
MYKIIDLQGDNGFGLTKGRFKTKKAIVERLASFHDVDFTGCINEKGEDIEVSIFEFLKQFKTTQAKLDYLLQYGEWEIKKV